MKAKACDTCRKIKMKCVVNDNEDICIRCARLGHVCKFTACKQSHQRLYRNPSSQRSVHPSGEIHSGSSNSSSPSSGNGNTDDRLDRLERQIERLIASKGRPEASLEDETITLAKRRRQQKENLDQLDPKYLDYCTLLEQGDITLLSHQQNKDTSSDGKSEDEQGTAAILESRLITWDEAHLLFQYFFRLYSGYLPTLNPTIYTPQETLRRSTILFTAICAVGSRSYTARPDLSMKLIIAAELAVAQMMLVGDCRSPEILQGLLVMSLWPRVTTGQLANKSWLYSGMALRIGPEVCKGSKRRTLISQTYYERFWLHFYSFDLLVSLHHAKQPTLLSSRVLIDIAETWWGRPGAARYDVIMCASAHLLNLLTTHVILLAKAAHQSAKAESHAEVTGGLQRFQTALDEWEHTWNSRISTIEQYSSPSETISPAEDWEISTFNSMKKQLDFHVNYAKLTMYSIGLHSVMKSKTIQKESQVYYDTSLESAKAVLSAMLPSKENDARLVDASYCGDIDISIACSSAQYLLNLAKLPQAKPEDLFQARDQTSQLSTLLSDMPLPSSVRHDQVQMLNSALESSQDTSADQDKDMGDVDASVLPASDAQTLLQSALDDQYWQSLFQTPSGFDSLGVFLPGMSVI